MQKLRAQSVTDGTATKTVVRVRSLDASR